jgi:hypothetical protein
MDFGLPSDLGLWTFADSFGNPGTDEKRIMMTRKDSPLASQTGSPGVSDSALPVSGAPASKSPAWLVRALNPLLTALLLTLILVTIPRLPLGTDDDSSWSAVLDFAHQQGLQFGTDISFSYGPLGFLITPYWSPSAPWLRVATDIGLAFGVAAGLCLALWPTGLLWRCFSISIFTLLAANADPRSELLVFTGLLCWALLCLACSGPPFLIATGAFIALAVFASLAKMTLFLPAVVSLAALIGLFLLRRKPRAALGLLLGFVSLFLLAWMALGQKLANLGPFLSNGFILSSGYDKAMWAEPFPAMLLPGILMVLLTAAVIGIRSWTAVGSKAEHGFWQRVVLLAWLIALLFVIWKHGFVRGGRDHLVVFLTLAPALALMVDSLQCQRPAVRAYTRGAGIACAITALLAFTWLFGGKPRAFIGRPFLLALTHARSLFAPAGYARAMKELQEAERQANQLPKLRSRIGQASVDIFGCNQAYALFNNLNYRPRPVFQSYAVYSAPLMNLNEQFYFSKSAPDSVLFRLTPIDQRFPTLEDASLFRDLLINYRPLDLEDPFLYLKAKQQFTAPSLTLIREGVVRPSEKLELKDYGNANIWLEISLEPTALGRALTFLYHPSEILLTAWRESARTQMAVFRAPAPMLAAGFLASPLLLDNRDVLNLYAGRPGVRPSSYSIELGPSSKYLWRERIAFRVYRIENQLGNSASPELARLLDFPGFEVAPVEIVANHQSFITVAGQPALLLPPDGFMRYIVPAGAKMIHGNYGFAPAAYVLGGATEGAEFRIEEERADGSLHLLHSQTLRPLTNEADRGMKPFVVLCPGTGTRKLLLRALPLAQNISAADLTCWSEIGIQ